MSERRSNFDVAYEAERKRVVRCLHKFDGEARAIHAASFRLGRRQRQRACEYFYTHPDLPHRGFPTRKAAALAALNPTPERTNDEQGI